MDGTPIRKGHLSLTDTSKPGTFLKHFVIPGHGSQKTLQIKFEFASHNSISNVLVLKSVLIYNDALNTHYIISLHRFSCQLKISELRKESRG